MRLRYAMLALATVLSTAAVAHTHLEASVPADKSRIKPPAAIELHFSEAARLTALTLQKGKDPTLAIKALPTKAATKLSVPMPALTAGDYVVDWRVVSDDGHVMSGKFGFTVDPAAPAAAGSATMPGHQH